MRNRELGTRNRESVQMERVKERLALVIASLQKLVPDKRLDRYASSQAIILSALRQCRLVCA